MVKNSNYEKIIVITVALFALFTGCKEENFRVPYGPDNGLAPGKIEFLEYESTPGGAIVKYRSPDDEDLLYVKAVYTLTSGRLMEAKASIYDN
ncbi:MAG: DUF4959 domain-containing protein [Bacteroides sp.]|nr:DUF4959 domain-containing protein [Bacteroides sp.]